MNLRVVILLVLALGAAVVTAQYVRTWLQAERSEMEQRQDNQGEAREQAVPTDQVLVASQDLEPGTMLQPSDLAWEGWPESQVKSRYVIRSNNEQGLQEAVGGVIRQQLVSGTPIVATMYVKPGDRGFLAAILEPGARAVTIPVTNAAVLSGLVFPGDRVDIILSHSIPAQGTSGESVQASETVLSDVRVLALDQRVNNPDNEPQGAQTVTFEVTPKQAETLSVAQQLGKLRLSLRSVADGSGDPAKPADTPSFTISSEVSRLLGRAHPPASENSDQDTSPQPFTVDVVRGTSSQTRSFGERRGESEPSDAPAEAAPE